MLSGAVYRENQFSYANSWLFLSLPHDWIGRLEVRVRRSTICFTHTIRVGIEGR